ncbi:hypothetical protein AGR6A_Cc60316 [Agrobacterium sp. NCPPB 925]|nr:hypothetical protein AGR6A_Cc60316 [Agrobacterium sp. NCPPB 925]
MALVIMFDVILGLVPLLSGLNL